MKVKVQSCVIAVLLRRNKPNFASSPFFFHVWEILWPLIFPKVIMSLVSLPPED